MRFHITIIINSNGEGIFCLLKVNDSDMNSILFNFKSLEETMYFVEKIVDKSKDIEEIVDKHLDYCEEQLYEKNKIKKKEIKHDKKSRIN